MDSQLKETIFDRISLVEGYATKQEKAIIEFIRSSEIRDLILLSITEFAERVGVGDATVLRFCRKMGLKGYSEFRFLLSQSQGSLTQRAGNDADEIFEDMVMALKSTHEVLDEAQIKKAAEIILKAEHVFAFGSGNSGAAAQELSNKVLRLGVNCVYRADAHFQLIAASLMTEKDALVLFSVSGSTQDMLELAKSASKQGTPLIIVTNYLKSPLAKYATALLYVVAKSAPLDSGSLVTKVSQLYVIDVLSRAVRTQMGDAAEENLRKTAIAVMGKEI